MQRGGGGGARPRGNELPPSACHLDDETTRTEEGVAAEEEGVSPDTLETLHLKCTDDGVIRLLDSSW